MSLVAATSFSKKSWYILGQLAVEFSRHEDFHTVFRQVLTKVDNETGCIGTVELDDLDPNVIWYQRAYLHQPRTGFDGPSSGFFTKGVGPEEYKTRYR